MLCQRLTSLQLAYVVIFFWGGRVALHKGRVSRTSLAPCVARSAGAVVTPLLMSCRSSWSTQCGPRTVANSDGDGRGWNLWPNVQIGSGLVESGLGLELELRTGLWLALYERLSGTQMACRTFGQKCQSMGERGSRPPNLLVCVNFFRNIFKTFDDVFMPNYITMNSFIHR